MQYEEEAALALVHRSLLFSSNLSISLGHRGEREACKLWESLKVIKCPEDTQEAMQAVDNHWGKEIV